jgi:NAD(P)-dependent dehydrogenase (short-subunit alcohol dehydrogenase family)
MIGSFDGRTAFVTGAASGVGLALARALSAEGAKVMLADIEQGALDAALRDLQDSGADARAVACDEERLWPSRTPGPEAWAVLSPLHRRRDQTNRGRRPKKNGADPRGESRCRPISDSIIAKIAALL